MSNQRRQMLPLRTSGDVDLSEDPNTGQRYRFEHLTLSSVLKDMYFSSNDPAPGDRVLEFDLPTVDGGRFRFSDLAKTGPALLIFGSSTCPVTDNAAPGLNELYVRFGDRVRFVMVNYNSHIESGGNDKLRRSQVEEILADQAREAHDEAPVVVAGDFNNSPAIRSSMFGPLTAAAFAGALIGNKVRRTSIHRKHPIDWIFVKNLKARSSQVAEVAHASDHYPVLAMLATAP